MSQQKQETKPRLQIIVSGRPIVKSKTFCPNPIARYGIPDAADSHINPHVVNSSAWRDFWEEQVYYCINGYSTGGTWIPGRFYYYLNFYKITTIGRGIHYPEYVDFDYDYFLLVEKAIREGYGIISVKGRRKGLTFKAGSLIDHGMRFTESGFKAGICASLESYADSFYEKYQDVSALSPPELRVNKLKDSQDKTILGYKIKTDQGNISYGSKNTLMVRTMHANANVFKGEHLNICVFEEAGENDKLESAYGATRACFMDGNTMTGTPILFGTGDKMVRSGAFQKMWNEADSHKLLRFWASRRKIYKPAYQGAISAKTGLVEEDIPYIKEQYPEEYMRIGMQDEKRAEELFLEELKLLIKNGNPKSIVEFIQNNPGNIAEAFQSVVENNYDTKLLTTLSLEVANRLERGYKEYVLEWVTNKDGVPVSPREVKIRYANTTPHQSNFDAEWKRVLIHDDGRPDLTWKRLHVGGIDGYDQDQSATSKSLGAMEIYRIRPSDGSMKGDFPVAIYYNRPPRKEDFFDICLKMAYYWDLNGDVLCDAGSPAVIDYFKNNGGLRFLAKRPKEFASENSEQKHEFGMKFVGPARPMGEGLVQSDILDNSKAWVFPHLINDCLGYNTIDGEKNDKDLHDAHLLCLVRKAVRKINPINMEERGKKKTGFNQSYIDADGDVRFREEEVAGQRQESEIDSFLRQMNPNQNWI